ncbi:MAG: NAD(P)-dependent oxidoreductase [Candidatus Omnitrophica bacterium]|nr:NAD(P)-dependent oxidoreductase [Candidatus Omnitrophota bacterium]MBU1995622.1 NAD(P)-dependent oxidoreductase [Candidatus Omnitrophota bacterium]MBU4333836.1 NAD(P)-dependent oxidoreductase [Candidatus Omnitrophota bacterium]
MLKSKVITQSETKRVGNFNEVSLGYSKKIAIDEARRCPQCTEPKCVDACPAGIDIPKFIRLLREGDVSGAYFKIKEENCFPSVCGRICFAPCEDACVLAKENAPIGIRALERYVADFGKSRSSKKEVLSKTAKRIAIIGAGPSGLAAACSLSNKGYSVEVFESSDKPGGILCYGVPGFRIPKKVLDSEINDIKASGVEIKNNFYVGKTVLIEELFALGFDAVLIATGAGIPKLMDLPGVNLGGVYYGEEFLMRTNLIKTNVFSRYFPSFPLGEKIAVVGSGNTALDCARSAIRFGREVSLIFRRTEDEMMVRFEERQYAKQEGIDFHSLTRPIEIISNPSGFVGGLKCVRMDYADEDSNGKWQLVEVPDSEFTIEADTVIIAIGHKPNSLVCKDSAQMSPSISKSGTIKVNSHDLMTNIEGVFACGNVISDARPLVEAIASGKLAADSIDLYLQKIVK